MRLVRDLHVGGIHVFGGGGGDARGAARSRATATRASASRKGDPYAGGRAAEPAAARVGDPAAHHRRLRRRRRLHPERRARGCRARWRIGADAATRNLRSAPASSAATEGRGLGVYVDFYPVVDVNNNPRNPIINIRSFGEDVGARVRDGAPPTSEGHPGRRHAGDRQALPGPRRHRHRHAPRPGAHRAPARAARPGGAGRRSAPALRPASTP